MNRTTDQLLVDICGRILAVAALVLAAQGASYARFEGPLSMQEPIYTLLTYTGCVMMAVGIRQGGLNAPSRGQTLFTMLGRLVLTWGCVVAMGLVLSFFLKEAGEPSRLWIVYWFLAGLLLLSGAPTTMYLGLRWLRKLNGIKPRRILIAGYGQTGREMHRRAKEQDHLGYRVSAIYAEPDEFSTIDPSVDSLVHLEDIPQYILEKGIDEVWITFAIDGTERMRKLRSMLRKTFVDLWFVPDVHSMEIFRSRVAPLFDFPAIDLNCPHRYGLEPLAKEFLDRVLASVALVLLAPLMIVIAACIKYSSPGPVIYKQARNGLNGKTFMIYKFRSMKLHEETQGEAVAQATKNDSRITRIGAFIRRTSLDELPQFFNVLKGDMSLVGPRPHAVQHNELYGNRIEDYMLRHRVKPGITGWAQIHGSRGETDTIDKMVKRVQLDMQYIQEWCLWLDIKIIVWTAFNGWTDENAY